MITIKNSYSSTYNATVDISKPNQVALPYGATNISVKAINPLKTGVYLIEGDIATRSALQYSVTAGAVTMASGTLESFGVYIGSRVVPGTFKVASNALTFTPTVDLSLPQDVCVTCYYTADVTAGKAQIGKSVRFTQSATGPGKSPVLLGAVEQTTGAEIGGNIIIHSTATGLVYPEASTFVIKTARTAGRVVLSADIPLLNAAKTLGKEGSLRIYVSDTPRGTAVDKALMPKNPSAATYLDITNINAGNGEITVSDDKGVLRGATGTFFNGIVYAQGGHVFLQGNTNIFGMLTDSNSISLVADAVKSSQKIAKVTIDNVIEMAL